MLNKCFISFRADTKSRQHTNLISVWEKRGKLSSLLKVKGWKGEEGGCLGVERLNGPTQRVGMEGGEGVFES